MRENSVFVLILVSSGSNMHAPSYGTGANRNKPMIDRRICHVFHAINLKFFTVKN